MAHISRFPFWIHILIETPAGINFIINPSSQLSSPAPQADLIIRQYGALLLVSVIISLIFALRPVDRTSGKVGGALSLYHILPVNRALARVLEGENHANGLGGPWVHLVVHVLCLISLAQLCIRGVFRRGL